MAQQAAPQTYLELEFPDGTKQRVPNEAKPVDTELKLEYPEGFTPPQGAQGDTSWLDAIIGDSLQRGASAFGQKFMEHQPFKMPQLGRIDPESLRSPQSAATALGDKVLSIPPAIGAGLYDVAAKARAAFESGDWVTGLRHAIEYAAPTILGGVAGSPGGPAGMLVGALSGAAATPAISEAGDMMSQGTPEAVGGALGTVTGAVGPAALAAPGGPLKVTQAARGVVSRATAPVVGAIRDAVAPGVTPQAAEAARYALDEGLPMSLPAATGNRFASALHEAAEVTPTGSVVAAAQSRRGQEAFRAKGAELATRAHPTPTTPVSAAENVEAALERRVAGYNRAANANYDELRRLQALPQNGRQVVVGHQASNMTTRTGAPAVMVPVTEVVQLPVDLRFAKTRLRPILREMESDEAWKQIVETNNPPGKALGFKAVRAIVNGPDYAPLVETDKLLGAVKDISRRKGGVSRLAVREVENAVQRAAEQGGPDVQAALRNGRLATVRKHIVQDVLDDLMSARKGEPQAAYKKAAANNDANIKFLRRLRSVAPAELPEIGRALFEEILGIGQADGGFTKTATMFNRWNDIGAETKALLFPDAQLRSEIGKFFQAAKMNDQVFNTSRSATAALGLGHTWLIFQDPTGLVAGWALAAPAIAHYFHHPGFVRAMTEGIKTASPQGRILNKIAVAQILNTAGPEMQVIGEQDPSAQATAAPGH